MFPFDLTISFLERLSYFCPTSRFNCVLSGHPLYLSEASSAIWITGQEAFCRKLRVAIQNSSTNDESIENLHFSLLNTHSCIYVYTRGGMFTI